MLNEELVNSNEVPNELIRTSPRRGTRAKRIALLPSHSGFV